jgi:hypothetical protein
MPCNIMYWDQEILSMTPIYSKRPKMSESAIDQRRLSAKFHIMSREEYIVRAGHISRAGFFPKKSRRPIKKSYFIQSGEDFSVIWNLRIVYMSILVILAAKSHNVLMACRVTCTFLHFEKFGIPQQSKRKFQTKLFHTILYSIRNSHLMIPNRCARPLANKASMNSPRAQISRNPRFSLTLDVLTESHRTDRLVMAWTF